MSDGPFGIQGAPLPPLPPIETPFATPQPETSPPLNIPMTEQPIDVVRQDLGLETSPMFQRKHGLSTAPETANTALFRALAMSDDPLAEMTKISAAETIGKSMGVPTSQAYGNLDELSKMWLGKVTPLPTFVDNLKNQWSNGVVTWEMNEIGNQLALGGDPVELMKRADELAKKMIPVETPKFFLSQWLEIAVNSAPQMLESLMAGGAMAAATSATAGAMLGSIAAVPTAGLSVAALAAAMGSVGMVVGSTKSMMDNMRGGAYLRMRRAGVPHGIASPLSLVEGTVTGALESSGTLLVGLPFVPFKSIGSRVVEKILLTGWATRAGLRLAAGGAGEGIEGSLQYVASTVADQVAMEIAKDPNIKLAKPAADQFVAEFGNQFYQGFGAGIIFGVTGLPKGIRLDISQMNTIKTLAVVIPDKESFIKAVAQAQPEDVAKPGWKDYLGKVWDAQQARVQSQLQERAAKEVKPGEPVTPEAAKAAVMGPLTRTPEGTLDTRIIQKGSSKEGTNAILVAGDASKGERYGYVKYETVGDTIYVRDLVSESQAQDVSREIILGLASKNPGKVIEWNPTDEAGITLKEDLIASNPLGAQAGLQWFTVPTEQAAQVAPSVPPQLTRDYFSQQMTKLFNLAPEEADAITGLSEALAANAGKPVDQWLAQYVDPSVAESTPEAQGVLNAGGGIAATTFRVGEQIVSPMQVDKAEFKSRVKATFSAMQGADFHHAVHEYFHMVERLALSPDQVRGFERAMGKLRETWTVPDVERLADLFEQYLATGNAPSVQLRTLFQQIAELLGKVVSFIKEMAGRGGPGLSPEFQSAYDSLFAKGIIRKPTFERVNRAEVTMPLEQAVVQPPAPETPTETQIDPSAVPVQEIALERITFSEDVPQFKSDANAQGIVEKLKGKKYIRLGTAPIVLWERMNGALDIITGRHRYWFALEVGEVSIPSQIVREADGFTAGMALTFDAESNIRDGQGSVKDYATYFRNTEIDEATAESRGLLSRDKGRKGFAIGKYATDDLYTLYRNGGIGEVKAAAIAAASKGDPRLTDAGLKSAKTLSAEEIVQQLGILRTFTPSGADVQTDMFGNAVYEESAKLATEQVKKVGELRAENAALKGATKLSKAEAAKIVAQYGFKSGDTKAMQTRITALDEEIASWKDWKTDPEKIAELRQRAGIEHNALFHPSPNEFTLTPLTDEELAAIAAKEKAALKGKQLKASQITFGFAKKTDAQMKDEKEQLALFHAAPEEVKAFNERALKEFGATTDPNYAAWILSDGTMLDFKGTTRGYGETLGMVRMLHKEIRKVLPSTDDPYRAAWSLGAIRMDYNRDYSVLQSVDKPNAEQLKAIESWIGKTGTVAVELVKPGTTGQTDAYKAFPNPTLQNVMDFYVSSEFYNMASGKALFHAAKGILLDPDTLSREVLSKMDGTLKAWGYDTRGPDDVLMMMKSGRVMRDGILWHPEWIAAYEKATESIQKRKSNAEAKKITQADFKNVDWKRVKQLGTTTDPREAGYIRPDGTLVDLSGKREGGSPGMRSFDHREAGGTAGMQELGAYGYVRMDANTPAFDIVKKPTSQQYSMIAEIADRPTTYGPVVELSDGLGEYRDTYYTQPARTFYREYPAGTKSFRILADIQRFYAGEEPLALFHPDMENNDPGAIYDSLISKAALYDSAEEFQADMEKTFGEADPTAAERYRRIWEAAHPPVTIPVVEQVQGIPLPEEAAQEYDYQEKLNLAREVSDPVLAQAMETGNVTEAQLDKAGAIDEPALREKLVTAQAKIDAALAEFTPEEQYILTLADELSTITATEAKAKRMQNKITSLRGRLKTAISKNARLIVLIEDNKDLAKNDLEFQKYIDKAKMDLQSLEAKGRKQELKETFNQAISSVKQNEADRRTQLKVKMYAERRAAMAKFRDQTRAAMAERRAAMQYREVRKKLIRAIMAPVSTATEFRGYGDRILEIQSGLDPATHRAQTIKERERSRAFFDAHPEAAALVPREVLDRIYSTPVQGMTLAQLEEIHNLIEGLRKLGGLKRSLELTQRKRGRDTEKHILANTVLRGEPLEKVMGAVKATPAALKAWLLGLKPGRVAQLLDGIFAGNAEHGAFWKIMQDRPNESWNAMQKKIRQRHDSVIAKLEGLKLTLDPLAIKRLQGFAYLGGTMDIRTPDYREGFAYTNGKKPTFQQAMYWYLGMQNESTRAALLAGNKIPEGVIVQGVKDLPQNMKDLADAIAEDFDNNFDRLRDAFIDGFNIDLPRVSHYVPMDRLEISYETRDEKVAAELTGRTGTRKQFVARHPTYQRIEIADEHQKPIATDLMSVWMEGIRTQEGFIHQDRMVKDMHAILESDEVRAAVQQKFGPELNKWLKKYINDIAQADAYTSMQGVEKWSRIARSNAAIAWLSFNVLTNAKQLVGWVNALADAGPLYLASAAAQFAAGQGKSLLKGKLLGNTLVDFVEERSELVRHRQISQEIEDMRRLNTAGYEQLVKKVGHLGMKSLEVIDKVSVVIGWKGVYDRVMAKTHDEQAAIKAADEATVRTQPSMRVQDMAEIYRSGEALKWFTMFTSDLNSTWNRMAFDVPAALRNGQVLSAFADVVSFGLAGVGIAVASGALAGDDEEKKRKRIIMGSFSQYFEAIPFVGSDAWAALSGKTFQSGGVKLFPAITYLQQIPADIKQGQIDQVVTHLAEAAAFGVGLPVSGPRRAAKAFTTGEWEALLGWPTVKKE